MKENFDAAMVYILADEGGFVNDPRDPGGATNKGITLAVFQAVYGPHQDVAALRSITREQACAIYRKNYADKISFDDLPLGLDYAMLDYAVNSGVSRAVRSLQAIIGTNQDGVMGAKTIAAVKAQGGFALVDPLCNARLEFLQRLSTYKTFGKGWNARVSRVRMLADRMTDAVAKMSTIIPDLEPTEPGNAKANVKDVKVTATKRGKAFIGTVAGAVVTAAPLAVVQLTPYADSVTWIKSALPYLATAGLIGTVLAGSLGLKFQNDQINSGAPQ